MYQKPWLNAILFLRWSTWGCYYYISFWTIFCLFTQLRRYHHFAQVYQKSWYAILFLREILPTLTEELACPSTTNVHAVSGHFAQNVPPTSRTQLGNPVNYNQMMYSSWYGAQQMDGQKKWYRGGWVPHVKSEHFSFI